MDSTGRDPERKQVGGVFCDPPERCQTGPLDIQEDLSIQSVLELPELPKDQSRESSEKREFFRVLMMLQAIGSTVRNLGDVRWHSIEDGLPGKGTGRHIACFILR